MPTLFQDAKQTIHFTFVADMPPSRVLPTQPDKNQRTLLALTVGGFQVMAEDAPDSCSYIVANEMEEHGNETPSWSDKVDAVLSLLQSVIAPRPDRRDRWRRGSRRISHPPQARRRLRLRLSHLRLEGLGIGQHLGRWLGW